MSSSLTSDSDYLKLHMQGTTSVSGTAFGEPEADGIAFGSGSVTINHNLGSIPMVRMFHSPRRDGVWFDSYAAGVYVGTPQAPYPTMAVDTTTAKLILQTDGDATFPSTPIFYRIYDLGDKSFTTDDIIDNVFMEDTVSINASAGSFGSPAYTTMTIPHGIASVPCWNVSFSPDGGSSWLGGSSFFRSGTSQLQAFGSADSTNFYITVANEFNTPQTVLVRYSLDYRESPILFSTDNNTYKHAGVIQTASLSIGGSLGSGATQTVTSTPISVDNPDFYEAMFTNSLTHPTKYHSIKEGRTYTTDTFTAFGFSEVILTPVITATTIAIRATLFNPSISTQTFGSATLNFRFIPYNSTLS